MTPAVPATPHPGAIVPASAPRWAWLPPLGSKRYYLMLV
jgi:hypothetical protein